MTEEPERKSGRPNPRSGSAHVRKNNEVISDIQSGFGIKEHKKIVDAKINQFLKEKRYNEAATLAVYIAMLEIDPQELVDVLMKAIKEYKAKKEKEKEKEEHGVA